jgi:hypothetical protein
MTKLPEAEKCPTTQGAPSFCLLSFQLFPQLEFGFCCSDRRSPDAGKEDGRAAPSVRVRVPGRQLRAGRTRLAPESGEANTRLHGGWLKKMGTDFGFVNCSRALPVKNVGTQFIAGDARYGFNLDYPIDGNAVPLTNGGAGNPQRAG